MFVFLAVTDSANNCGGLALVRGLSEGVSHTGSTVRVRGDWYPSHVEVFTRFPVLNNSMVAVVDKCIGSADLSIGVIVAEDRYVINIH